MPQESALQELMLRIGLEVSNISTLVEKAMPPKTAAGSISKPRFIANFVAP
jgi:hypothetical protein